MRKRENLMESTRTDILKALVQLRLVVGRDRLDDQRIDEAIAVLEALLDELDDEALKA